MGETSRAVQLSEMPQGKWGRVFSILAFLLALLVSLALVGVVSATALYQTVYRDRIYLGVKVGELDVGGLRPARVRSLIEDQFPYYREAQITLRHGGRTWQATPHELGARLDVQATTEAAYRLGRGEALPANLAHQLQLLRNGATVDPITDFNEGVAKVYLSRVAREVDQPARDASLTLNGAEVHVTQSQRGQRLNVAAALDLVRDRVTTLSGGTVDLVVEEVPPLITDVSQAKARLDAMLGSPVLLAFNDRQWTIERATLAQAVSLRQARREDGTVGYAVEVAPAPIASAVESLAPQINQQVRDGRLDFNPATGTVTPVVTSQEGRTLQVSETVARIVKQMRTSDRVVPMAVAVQKPAVDTRDIGALGIKELVWEETSYFAGSSAGRVKNIQVSASQFNHLVIPPGGTFSFNENVGEISAETGYDETSIIVDNQISRGIGGGVCQVSTTVFRAAFWSGFPILERWPHGFRVFFYEQGNKPIGLDATIYTPSIDFKFRNALDSYLLIETEVDPARNALTFRFYGTKPNWTVEMDGPFTANEVKPESPLREKDPDLAPGQTRQVQLARNGLDVTVYRMIKQGGQVIKQERFFSRYVPTQAVYKIGVEG